MQEQNFEKEVRHKMDGFNVAPSVPVWQNIEAQLQKKRNRKRFLFWLLPFLLLSAGVFGYFFHQNTATKNTFATIEPAPAETPSTAKIKNDKSTLINKNNYTTLSIKTKSKDRILNKFVFKESKQNNKKLVSFNQISPVSNKSKTKTKTAATNFKIENDTILKTLAITNKTITTHDNSTLTTLIKTDIIANKTFEDTTVLILTEVPVLDHPTEKEAPKNNSQKTWHWSLFAQAGLSNTRSLLFEKAPALSQDFSSAPANNPGSFVARPLPAQKGFSYSIGADVKRALTNRLALTSGLHYAFYSTKNKVGNAGNSPASVRYSATDSLTVAEYYTTGQQQELKNKYHFIEIPVGVELSLHRKIPLFFNAGFTIAQLISTDALLYNEANRIYYKDKKAYSKTGLYVFTSLNYTFYKGKKIALNAGPHLQYGITELEQKSGNPHRLFSAGIKTGISF